MGWIIAEASVTREVGDDATRTVTYYTEAGSSAPAVTPNPRPYTAAENAAAVAAASHAAHVAAEESLLTQLQAGIAQIKAARDAAQADTATAATLKTQAESLSATIAARKTAVDASTPAATVAYVTAVRNELSWIDAQLKVIVDAMAGMYAYRHAVDTNAVMTDNAILWLAKQVSGDVLADED